MRAIVLAGVFFCFCMPWGTCAASDVFYERVVNRTPMGPEWAAWISNEILTRCEKYQVDPFLAFALFEQESNYDMGAYSSTGAIGITQLMPETAANMGVDPWDPIGNIEGGVRYLAFQLQQFSWAGDMQNTYAIAAYNAGPNAVYTYGTVPPYEETYAHVTEVALNYQELCEDYYSRNKGQ